MRLLRSSPEQVEELLGEMRSAARAITKSVHEIIAYSRNISREEAWALPHNEREIALKHIKTKMDTLEKTKGSVNLF